MRNLQELSAREAFCIEQNQVPEWLTDLKHLGIQLQVPIISDDVGCYLQLFCKLQQPKRILEIGCGISYAAHWMLLDSKESEFVGIDLNAERIHICKDYFAISDFGKKVELHCKTAEAYFSELPLIEKFDLIFQDSVKKTYGQMLPSCYKALKKGGWLIVDNIFFEGRIFSLPKKDEKKYSESVKAMKAFFKQIKQFSDLKSHYLPIGDGLLVIQKQSDIDC